MYKKTKDRFKIKIAKHVKKIVLKIRKYLFVLSCRREIPAYFVNMILHAI